MYGIFREAFFKKYEKNNAYAEKLGHETISWGMWWVCWRPWSVRARPKCKSKSKTRRFLSVPWVATHNENLQRSAEDPPRSTLLGSNGPRNLLIKKYPMEPNSTAHPRDMGQGIMSGSNTPWAQGPANFQFSVRVGSEVFDVRCSVHVWWMFDGCFMDVR